MSISAIAGFSGIANYRISSINGNPYSMYAIQKIGRNMDNQRGRALVIGQEKPEEDLYVKDYGELAGTKSTATGDFAELLSIQESAASNGGLSQEIGDDAAGASEYASYFNDTIGMMGFQNGLRERLNGVGFTFFE